MDVPQDHDKQLLERGGVAAVVIRNKERLLELFCQRAQATLDGAKGVSHPVLIDTLPAFITRLALALSPDNGTEFASQYSNIARQHGNERARFAGYTLQEVIKEYQFMREIFVAVLREETMPTDAEWAAMLDEHNKFAAWAREKGWLLAGEALEEVSTATTVSIRDGQRIVTDGPFAETKEHLGGYYVIDVPSLDDAIETAFRIPDAAAGRIEIRPIKEFG